MDAAAMGISLNLANLERQWRPSSFSITPCSCFLGIMSAEFRALCTASLRMGGRYSSCRLSIWPSLSAAPLILASVRDILSAFCGLNTRDRRSPVSSPRETRRTDSARVPAAKPMKRPPKCMTRDMGCEGTAISRGSKPAGAGLLSYTRGWPAATADDEADVDEPPSLTNASTSWWWLDTSLDDGGRDDAAAAGVDDTADRSARRDACSGTEKDEYAAASGTSCPLLSALSVRTPDAGSSER
mmetsp:Transcript_22870/g.65413  ORF Transcript_22870/g.65413 Transcript_22870/m.65413 type:complete len:242 (-) Transcript_22870:549-1274(-)